jgi:pimeloyl-ACP methyl ester carboxylesterase
MNDFVEQKIELSTGPLHFLKGGTGPALIHLHSGAGPRVSPALERLAGKHTIYMPTMPGFNGTPPHAKAANVNGLAGLAAEFISKSIGRGCDVMAESFGGWIALWLAVRHPELVEQLVLEAPAGLRTKGVGGLPADPAERDRKLYAVPERAPKDPRYAAAIPGNFKAMQSYTGGETLDDALLQSLPRIKARTLLLFGTKEEVIPVEDVGRRLKNGIPHSHLSYIYGAAHAVEFDQPERVARLVGAFLERGEAFVVRTAEVA